jgi:hypothetical protein
MQLSFVWPWIAAAAAAASSRFAIEASARY